MAFDPMAMSQQLRAQRQQDEYQRQQNAMQSRATTNGGVIGQAPGSTFTTQAQQPQQVQDPSVNALQQGVNAYTKYKDMGRLLSSGSGAFSGATPATMSAMGTGGGSSLGSMGLMSSAPAVSYPGAAPATSSSLGAGAGGSGLAGTAGGLAGLAALSYLGDKEMNENKGSMINADKLNKMGTVNGIGLRFGDLANGFNPATWLSDPSKAAKGLGNFFTLGFLDKI